MLNIWYNLFCETRESICFYEKSKPINWSLWKISNPWKSLSHSGHSGIFIDLFDMFHCQCVCLLKYPEVLFHGNLSTLVKNVSSISLIHHHLQTSLFFTFFRFLIFLVRSSILKWKRKTKDFISDTNEHHLTPPVSVSVW